MNRNISNLEKFSNVIGRPLVYLIIDYRWFAENQEEIDNWCFKQFDYHPRQGMVLSFNNESDVLLFLLRWS